MFKIFQQTLSKTVKFEGVGLHTGNISKVTVKPAENNQGIIFKRIDLRKNNIVELISKTFQLQNFVQLSKTTMGLKFQP